MRERIIVVHDGGEAAAIAAFLVSKGWYFSFSVSPVVGEHYQLKFSKLVKLPSQFEYRETKRKWWS